jgi:5-methylcytosine-specific restriction endonuclease McrA
MSNTSDETASGWAPLLDQLKVQDMLKSDAALAVQLGVTRSFISAVRTGRKNISPELGEAIFRRLGKRIAQEDQQLFRPLRLQRDSALRRLDPLVRSRVLARAAGKCELCGCAAPFLTLGGEPYLEIHHIVPFGYECTASAESSVALCPNCHRKVELRPSDADTETLLSRARASP